MLCTLPEEWPAAQSPPYSTAYAHEAYAVFYQCQANGRGRPSSVANARAEKEAPRTNMTLG
jgi:hypothetical protein